jgi:diguanylate cyclase (GGDEF)-like protein/PAS domain S-box-containing protein
MHPADSLLEVLLFGGGAATLAGVWLRYRRRERLAKQALQASEERFRHLTSLSADWFWETDADYRISWMSGGPAVAALFGDALVYGRKLWEIPGLAIEPKALVEHLERLHRVDARLPFFDFEIMNQAGEAGSPQLRRIHTVLGRPRHDGDGRFIGFRGVGRDITERRRSEIALGLAKERLELALDGSGASLWDLDLRSGRVYLSEGWARLLGRPQASTQVEMAELQRLVHRDDHAVIREAAFATMKGERDEYAVEHRVRSETGEWLWVLSRGKVAQRDPASGRALRMIGTNLDITARKRAEQALRDAEERYRSLIELAPDGVVVASGGTIEYANPAAARILRAGSVQRLLGVRAETLVHPEHLARYRERGAYLEAGPGTTAFEERRLACFDGGEVVVEVAGVSYLERGRLVVQSVLRDVTEQRRNREALAERERRFRDVVEASGEYVWETDAAWNYTYLSERVEAVLGHLRHEMLGRSPREFMPLDQARALEDWFAQRAARPEPFRELELRSLTRAGRVIWQSVTGVPVLDAAGRLTGYRGTGADITARKQAEERIQYLANRDALTGLPNRQLLADRAGQAVLAAARERGSLALLVIDLDRFKLVNDSLGHAAGDALLRAVSERLAATLRRDDTLARVGEDEFVLLWNRLKSTQDAAVMAQRIAAILARPFTVEGRTLGVTASIGISVYPGDGQDFPELLRSADAAMHDAKETRRGSFRFCSPELNARAAERLSMENELRQALARGELQLRWQAVMGARGAGRSAQSALVGAEALLRWQHPREGLISPDRFIEVAEESGLVRALGEWTLERVLSQVGAWRRAGLGQLWFALNVSASELAQGEAYAARLEQALAAHGVPGDCLELEVTERVLMPHLGENIQTLKRIGALGVRVAIDDFGTGYSSLAYLRQLPIDKLKIDQSFLRELAVNPDDAMLVKTMVAMAKGLGLHVAAEGVETEAQLSRLLSLGCDEWQGHFASLPLEAAAFERLALEAGAVRAGAAR